MSMTLPLVVDFFTIGIKSVENLWFVNCIDFHSSIKDLQIKQFVMHKFTTKVYSSKQKKAKK